MKSVIVCVGTDLGVHVDGAKFGPKKLANEIKDNYEGEIIEFIQDDNIIKSTDKSDLCKNKTEVNKLNELVFNTIEKKIKDGYFPITLGGDHTVAIPSALANCSKNKNIGIIWFDAHTDYNTFKTTITGNMHGLPLAAITGYDCISLREFFKKNTIDPKNTVVVGARSIDDMELVNLKDAGVTVFSTEDIKKEGVRKITEKAFEIAGHNTNGIHISYDLDLIDPTIAPGVSVPEINGINKEEALEICNIIIDNFNKVTAFDLVEFNPLKDINNKTEHIALDILNKVINKIEKIK